MKALSIRQPWAWRILHEGKDIENRDWPTKYRGTFLIHAAKGVDAEDRDEVRAKAMPLGGIVGRADIVDCVTDSASEWFFGRFGFVLANVRPLPFIPCRGMLSFFTPDITAEVVRMWHSGELSEGQGSRILSLDRVAFRTLCDGAVPSTVYEPYPGAFDRPSDDVALDAAFDEFKGRLHTDQQKTFNKE